MTPQHTAERRRRASGASHLCVFAQVVFTKLKKTVDKRARIV